MSTQVLQRLSAPNMSGTLPPRRFLPQPVETTTKSRRRNAPEAYGVTSKSNKGPLACGEPSENSLSAKKSFGPFPIETTSKSNRKEVVSDSLQAPDASPTPDPSPVRRLPQPVETTTTSSRRKKFSPQLIETTKRSRKAGDVGLALLPTEKTEIVTESKDLPLRPSTVPRPSALRGRPVSPSVSNSSTVLQASESRFSSANLSRNAGRRHSFRVPDLTPIESQPDSEASSEGSDCPSLSTSRSTASHDTELHKHASRVRESCDDRFSGYLLDLAAKAAEKQLREQAMAAYPNEKQHEPVDHFAIDRESDSSDETDEDFDMVLLPHERGNLQTLKSESIVEMDWESKEMQTSSEKHARHAHPQSPLEKAEFIRRISATGPFSRLPQLTRQPEYAADGLDRMRSAASPPMLGADLEFPICESPRHTRFEVDQYPGHHRGSGVSTPRQRSGLWTPGAGNSRHGSGKGLWMGVCAITDKDGLAPPGLGRTGLITPAENEYSYAEPDIMEFSQHLPASPPDSHSGSNMACIDNMLMAEQEIQRECTDAFVTQVYNYLSLGYPALARKFDEELSKITRIPVEELRRDDKLANTKGYVGTPEGKGVTQDGVSDGQCARWRALRMYVREWARQKPRMAAVPDLEAWGDRARRGSWAI